MNFFLHIRGRQEKLPDCQKVEQGSECRIENFVSVGCSDQTEGSTIH